MQDGYIGFTRYTTRDATQFRNAGPLTRHTHTNTNTRCTAMMRSPCKTRDSTRPALAADCMQYVTGGQVYLSI